MNKIKVGYAESPNLTVAKSKIGSLSNARHRPGGGEVKIENRKLEWNAKPRTQAKNETYTPKGGDKKVRSGSNMI
jgi:microtubule-associated protein tau